MGAKRSPFLAVVLVAGACGGGDETAQRPPTLPSALGRQLAAEADATARLLEAGDPCGAATRAAQLQQRAIAALNRPGQVPDELKEDLGTAVADLVDRAQSECAAAAPPPMPPPPTTTLDEPEDENGEDEGERDNGRGKKKGHDKKKGKGKD